MDRTSRIMLRKIILDIFCLFIVGLFALVFYLFGTPYKRGFFCNDESLHHPFHDSTVTNSMLYVIGGLLPVSTMLLAEYIHARNTGEPNKVLLGMNIPAWMWTAYCKVGLFGFGAFATILTTDVGKYTIGRLRPHFMSVCMPSINCSLPENQFRYIENFVCTAKNLSPSMQKELRLSFPSGHSSFSFYAMVYLVLYLELRFTWKGSKLLKNVLQFICLLMAWFTALTRVSNYKHHWSDVLAGSVLGSVVAVIVAVNVADLFKDRRSTMPEKLPPGEYEVEDGTQGEINLLRSSETPSYGGINGTQEVLILQAEKKQQRMFEEKKIINQFSLKQNLTIREKPCIIINVDQKKLTEKQKSVLVDFIKNNVNLILPKVTDYVIRPDRLDAQNLWKQIAEELNGMPGPTKSWRQWRTSWQYVYRFARQNLETLQKRAVLGTLTDTQMNLLNLINLTRANNLSLDSVDNDITENLSDEEDVFLEEEWLEDIDVNDKESELSKIDKPHSNIPELTETSILTATRISSPKKNVPISETPNSADTRVYNLQENINPEPSTSQKAKESDTDYLKPSNFEICNEISEISSVQNSRNRKRDLSSRENELKSRERELTSRKRELTFRETELKQRICDSSDREQELINRERELIDREREVIRRERELISREGHMLSLNRELLDFESKLILRAKEIEQLKKKIRDRMEKRMKFDSSFIDNLEQNDC